MNVSQFRGTKYHENSYETAHLKLCICFNPLKTRNPLMGLDLHFLLRQNRSSEKEIQYFLGNYNTGFQSS